MKQSKQHRGITVFYSYASADKELRDQLANHLIQLKRDKLISEWHDQQVLAGSDRAQVIDQAINSADLILLLISADFLASEMCYQIEMEQSLERHQRGDTCVVPIILRPCDWQCSPFAHLQCLPRNDQPITVWPNRDEAFADVVAGIRSVIENLSLPKVSAPSTARHSIWNIPYQRNPFFMGREDLLSQVHAQLQRGLAMALSQHPQAISGLGGIGKTQIAVEYAYRFGWEYQAVLWAHAESRETLVSSYVALAVLLDLPEQDVQEHTITVQAVKRWLQTHSFWLLILDNADELALVPEFLPPVLGGHLLLTTRAQAMGRLANRIEVEIFSAEQSALFLLRRAGLLARDATLSLAATGDHEQAVQISRELGGLPLALDQAGAYLEETGCSLSAYRQLYQQRRADLLRVRRGLVADHPAPVATTWSLSFQRVEEKNPAAADLLRLCAFLQPDAIPEEIVLEGGQQLGPHIQTLATNPLAFHEAIGVLRAYSLLQWSAGKQLLSTHRLVQVVLQDAMDEHERAHWRERVIQGLNVVLPAMSYATMKRGQRLVPHVLVCIAEMGEQEENRELAMLLGKAADHLREQRQYEQAEQFYQRALHIWEQELGSQHPRVAYLLNGLGKLYGYQGKHEQAEPLHQRALLILEQVSGPEHPDVCWSLNWLANLYTAQGKYEQAESLFQRALRIEEQAYGSEQPISGRSLTGLANLSHWSLVGLANLYAAQGKYEQAESLFQRALRIQEQAYGSEDLDLVHSLTDLANLYQMQGKYEQAGPLFQRALHILEQAYGSEDLKVVHSLTRLASLYQMQGKYEQAEPLFQRALRIEEQAYGSEQPISDWLLYFRRAYIYLYLRKSEDACADFAKYASLQPGNVNAAWMIVYAALSKQRPAIEIAERLETIATLDPQCHEAYTCRGVALGLRGKPQEGLTELEQALHLNARSEDALFWKGMMGAYLGHDTMARESIEQALQAGLPPILLTPLYWLEQDSPQFYQEYAEPLLKQYELT